MANAPEAHEGVAQQVRAGAIGGAGRPQIAIHQRRNAPYREAVPAAIQKERRVSIIAVGEIGQQCVGRGAVDGQPTQPPPLAHHLQRAPALGEQVRILSAPGSTRVAL